MDPELKATLVSLTKRLRALEITSHHIIQHLLILQFLAAVQATTPKEFRKMKLEHLLKLLSKEPTLAPLLAHLQRSRRPGARGRNGQNGQGSH